MTSRRVADPAAEAVALGRTVLAGYRAASARLNATLDALPDLTDLPTIDPCTATTEELTMKRTVEEARLDAERLADALPVVDARLTALDASVRRRTTVLGVALTVGAVLVLVVVWAAFQVSLDNTRRIEANNAKFCPFVSIFTPRDDGTPAFSTPRGKEIEREADRLAVAFGCASTTVP